MEEKSLIFSGDIHGNFKELVWNLVYRYRITDANVIILGDCGIGFGKPSYYNILFKELSKKLDNSEITIYMIRGNHDNKEYWINNPLDDFPRFKFLKDHEVVNLSGKTIYPIGGARSVDISYRLNYNKVQEEYGSSKRIWWPDEIIEKKYKDIPNNVDIICSHSAPICFSPVVIRLPGEMDDKTYNDILDERRYLDYIFLNIRCKYWYYGHFHKSITSSIDGVVYKCLDMMEIYQLINIKEDN